MSTEGRQRVESYVASGDLSGLQYRVVDMLANRAVGHGTANKGFGVLLNKPKSGEHASVATKGLVKVRAAAAITVGSMVVAAGSGWAQVTAGGVTDVGSAGAVLTPATILGRARTACASGSLFELDLDPQFTLVLSA